MNIFRYFMLLELFVFQSSINGSHAISVPYFILIILLENKLWDDWHDNHDLYLHDNRDLYLFDWSGWFTIFWQDLKI